MVESEHEKKCHSTMSFLSYQIDTNSQAVLTRRIVVLQFCNTIGVASDFTNSVEIPQVRKHTHIDVNIFINIKFN